MIKRIFYSFVALMTMPLYIYYSRIMLKDKETATMIQGFSFFEEV